MFPYDKSHVKILRQDVVQLTLNHISRLWMSVQSSIGITIFDHLVTSVAAGHLHWKGLLLYRN